MVTQEHPQTASIIDDYALARIDYRVSRLKKAFRLSDEDAEDLRQGMVVELLKAGRRHDPKRSQRNTFINRALDRHYLHVARRLSKQQSPTPLSELPRLCPVTNDPGKGELSDQARSELRMDLAELLPTLPPLHQQICELLCFHRPGEVARRLGLHRSTVHRAINAIRRRFAAAGLGGDA